MSEAANGGVTLREVYTLINTLRTELVAEIGKVSTNVNAQLVAHQSEHKDHESRHDIDQNRRSSLIRWAVTSILTGVGVVVAIYVAFRSNR